MNNFKSIGMASGILVGLVICFFVFKYSNSNHKAKTEYDERQREIRGKGFTAAFYAAMALEAIFTIVFYGGNPPLLEPYMAHAGVIFCSCTILACYLIWNKAYWGLNNDTKRYFIILAVTLILNAFPVIMTLIRGEMIVDGKLSSVFINLLASLMLIIIGIVMLVRHLLDRESEKE